MSAGRDYTLPPGEVRDDLPPLQPAAHPEHYVRRVSRDGFGEWVDPTHLKKSMRLPVFLRKRADKPGRLWDHLRSAEPVIMGTGYRPPNVDPYAKWRDFINATRQPHTKDSEVVSYEFLNQLMPGLDAEAQGPDPTTSNRHPKSSSHTSWLQEFVLRRPWAPLIFRLIVLSTSIAAMVLSVHLYLYEMSKPPSGQTDGRSSEEVAQALVGMIIDIIAIPYLGYMTWDDVTGKPMGLRPPTQKLSLTLMDLFFIIFKSAGTALAFEALVYRSGSEVTLTTDRARALAAMMLVGLVAWVLNFAISVFRVVEGLPGKK